MTNDSVKKQASPALLK